LGHFRNLLIFQVSRGDLRMIEASEAEAAALKEQSSHLHTDGLTRMMEVLTDCEGRLRDTTSKKILVEVALLKMIEARDAVSIDTVLKELQQLRSGAPAASRPAAAVPARAAATPAPARVPASAPSQAPIVAAPPGEIDLQQLWAGLVEAVGRASPFVKTYFVEAHPVSFAKNVLTVGFDPEFADHLPLVDNAKNHALVQTKLAELGHPHSQVKFIRAEAPPREKPAASIAHTPPPSPMPKPTAAIEPAKPAPATQPSNNDAFKDDPLIKKALETFKGRIVEVRS
jgi:DNA polymerase-3 subunit gamma/tau